MSRERFEAESPHAIGDQLCLVSPDAADRRQHVVVVEQLRIVLGRVLRALVGVLHQLHSSVGPSGPERYRSASSTRSQRMCVAICQPTIMWLYTSIKRRSTCVPPSSANSSDRR